MNAINVESPKKKESLGMRIKEEFRIIYDLLLVLNNDRLLAIYKRYDKDKSMMKPYKVFREDLWKN